MESQQSVSTFEQNFESLKVSRSAVDSSLLKNSKDWQVDSLDLGSVDLGSGLVGSAGSKASSREGLAVGSDLAPDSVSVRCRSGVLNLGWEANGSAVVIVSRSANKKKFFKLGRDLPTS